MRVTHVTSRRQQYVPVDRQRTLITALHRTSRGVRDGLRPKPHSHIVVTFTTRGRVMDQPISAADANRSFSRILHGVRGGQSYVVTAHGKPIARIIPCGEADAVRQTARVDLLRRLEGQKVKDIGPWSRDELYER